MLEVENLVVHYGMIEAVKNISFTVQEGEIVTLIGANGAGKTTTMQTISGLLSAHDGSIRFDGQEITKIPPHQIVSLGLVQVPEGRHVFAEQTVLENLRLGAYQRRDGNDIQADYERVFALFPRLKERQSQIAGTLSGGEQQMLAMGRALMAKPRMILLDEPSMGLSPLLVKEIFHIIRIINQQEHVTVLLVEQNARMALSVASRGYVLETGKVVTTGTGEELLSSPAIKKAYLGG